MPGVKRRRSRSGRPAKRRMTKKFMQNYARKVRRKSFATRVKRTVLKMSETKYKNLDVTANTNQFDGDGTYQTAQSRIFNQGGTRFRLWSDVTTSQSGIWPSQGDTDANREGDRIMCVGMKIRGKLTFLPQYRNALIKAWYLPYNDLQGEPYNTSEFFHNVTGGGLVGLWPLSPIQCKRWPGARYLGEIKPPKELNQNNADGDPENTAVLFQYWIPMKRKIHFLRDDVTTPSGMPRNGVIVMFGSSMLSDTAITVTVAANVDMHATLYWKDI